jgi:hypothetical protein
MIRNAADVDRVYMDGTIVGWVGDDLKIPQDKTWIYTVIYNDGTAELITNPDDELKEFLNTKMKL